MFHWLTKKCNTRGGKKGLNILKNDNNNNNNNNNESYWFGKCILFQLCNFLIAGWTNYKIHALPHMKINTHSYNQNKFSCSNCIIMGVE